jgi:hypothetical protein
VRGGPISVRYIGERSTMKVTTPGTFYIGFNIVSTNLLD